MGESCECDSNECVICVYCLAKLKSIFKEDLLKENCSTLITQSDRGRTQDYSNNPPD